MSRRVPAKKVAAAPLPTPTMEERIVARVKEIIAQHDELHRTILATDQWQELMRFQGSMQELIMLLPDEVRKREGWLTQEEVKAQQAAAGAEANPPSSEPDTPPPLVPETTEKPMAHPEANGVPV